MRFLAVHKVVSYLSTLTCLAALFASGEVSLVVGAIVALGALVSWYWEPPRVRFERFQTLWNVLTLLMLARTIFEAITGASVLLVGVDFVLFLTVNKLFNRRTSRDYQQLYVLSFLQMVAATVLNTDLSYGVLFVLYTVFVTWTLILFHLKREMEENFLLKYGGKGGDSLEGRPVQIERVLNSRRLIGGRFLAVTSLVSLVVFTGAATMFFLFPRVGFGYFFKKQRAGITMAGFSEDFELGRFGTIKNDPTVVLRVEFEDPAQRDALPPYWRGTAYDTYDGRRWSRSKAALRLYVRRHDGLYNIAERRSSRSVVQSIYLEPMESRVLFGLNRVTAIALDQPAVPLSRSRRRRIRRDPDHTVYYEQVDQTAFRYRVHSEPVQLSDAQRAVPISRARDEAVQQRTWRGPRRFLQLPRDLDPRIAQLAAAVVGDATTINEAAERVERHLRTQYAYTLDLQRDERYSPLADFLFVQRRGHCEYFSTAMVIMLRTQGIPARSVNGFYGGTWNDFGNYLAVSQGDAHSWVEVWLGDDTWQTRDPTPSGPSRAAEASFMSRVRQYADALRLRWYKYVIEYDLQAQVSFLEEARQAWRGAFGSGDKAAVRRFARKIGLLLVLVLLCVAAFILIRRKPSRMRARQRRAQDAAELFHALVSVYGKLGFTRHPSATATEFLRVLRTGGAPGLDLAERVVARYEATRFGGEDLPREARNELVGALKALRKEAR